MRKLILSLLCAASLAALIPLSANASDPNAVGIAAIVDDKVISTLDVNERIALVMGMTNIPDTPETRARLMPQILRELVDERLKIEEAGKQGITISDEKLKLGIAKIEVQSGKPPGSLEQYLVAKGMSPTSFRNQLRAQLAWNEIVIHKIRPHIRISDAEVTRYVKHKAEAPVAPQDAKEVMISLIQLPVETPAAEPNVHTLADKLTSELRAGANFNAVAAQFSGSGRAVEPFWVELSQIDPKIAAVLVKTDKDGITDPIRTSAGYQIVKLLGTRAAPPAAAVSPDNVQAELAYKQILMALKPDAKRQEAELLLTLAREVAKSPGKCNEKSMAGAKDLGDFDFTVTLDRALSNDLPDKLREVLMNLRVGQVSDPVITPKGIRIFMLCERIDLPAGNKPAAPLTDDATRQAIFDEKMELESQKYLRNLRREAFIELRQH